MIDPTKKFVLVSVLGSTLILVALSLAVPPDPLIQELAAVAIAILIIGAYFLVYRREPDGN